MRVEVPKRPDRPVAGQPPNGDFYSDLLDAYDVLVVAGSRQPGKVLAQRYDVPEGTVRSWLYRGRRHLGRDSVPILVEAHCRTCSCPGTRPYGEG